MKLREAAFRMLLLACLITSGTVLNGQPYETKSGTLVTPADREMAHLRHSSKNSAHYTDGTAGTYIIVTRPDWVHLLQPYVDWKQAQGFRVELMVMQSRESDSIRTALQERYDRATAMCPAQKYVLLIGDIDRLRACVGRHAPGGLDNHVTDLYYGEYTGDYIPEASVGRLSVADSNELVSALNKIILYEQGRWAAAEQVLLTAGKEERGNALTTTNGQVNYVSGIVANRRPELDTVCFRNPASGEMRDSVVAALNRPNALVNYTAHCTRQGWSLPAIDHSALVALREDVPTVYVNNCCLSNAFDGTCFGEQLLRRADGGGVCVVGATNETLWDEDYYWAVGAKYPPELHPSNVGAPGAFDQAVTDWRYDADELSVGAMNYAGCSAVTLVGSPFDAFYWEIYCILGDPSMTLWWGHVDSLSLTIDDSLTAGATELHVTSLPWSRISAIQTGKLIGTAMTDSNGLCRMLLRQGLSNEPLTMTATRPGSIYKQLVLPVGRPSEGRLSVMNSGISDDGGSLQITLRNVGSNTASGHWIAFAQNMSETHMGIQLVADSLGAWVETVAAGEEAYLQIPLGRYLIGELPVLNGELKIGDSLGAYSVLYVALDIEDERPELNNIQLLDSTGVPVSKLIPGTDYWLSATFTHPAELAELWLNGNQLEPAIDTDSMSAPFRLEEGQEHLHIQMTLKKDRWEKEYERWVLTYNNIENFESGGLADYPWKCNNMYPWQIDSDMTHGGNYSARSAPIADGLRSTLTLEIETLVDDSISFYYHVSSEGSDWLYFYLDGRRRGFWSGNSGWKRYARQMAAGHHVLQWIYQKDASGIGGNDCAHIDDIRLPLAIWEHPYGHAICDNGHNEISAIERTQNDMLEVYPNPSNGWVTLTHNSCPYTRGVTIHDALGRVVDEIKIEAGHSMTQYSTRHLRFGIYTLLMHNETNNIVKKIMVTP